MVEEYFKDISTIHNDTLLNTLRSLPIVAVIDDQNRFLTSKYHEPIYTWNVYVKSSNSFLLPELGKLLMDRLNNLSINRRIRLLGIEKIYDITIDNCSLEDNNVIINITKDNNNYKHTFVILGINDERYIKINGVNYLGTTKKEGYSLNYYNRYHLPADTNDVIVANNKFYINEYINRLNCLLIKDPLTDNPDIQDLQNTIIKSTDYNGFVYMTERFLFYNDDGFSNMDLKRNDSLVYPYFVITDTVLNLKHNNTDMLSPCIIYKIRIPKNSNVLKRNSSIILPCNSLLHIDNISNVNVQYDDNHDIWFEELLLYECTYLGQKSEYDKRAITVKDIPKMNSEEDIEILLKTDDIFEFVFKSLYL